MARDRHQDGRVEETGKKRKKWRGHYYVYLRASDGTERRAHRSVTLGLKASLKKWEAEAKLREIIASETGQAPVEPTPSDTTLHAFWLNQFRPAMEPTWKSSSRANTAYSIERYVIDRLGDRELSDISKLDCQAHLNALAAEGYGYSAVSKARVWLRAILEEALDADLIQKNPARKLRMPETPRVARPVLTGDDIAHLLAACSDRDRLIVRMFAVLGLRPGELFALRRNDVDGDQLRIDESFSESAGCVEPKTAASVAYVWMPDSIRAEVHFLADDLAPGALLFPSASGTPISPKNFLNRNIPAFTRCDSCAHEWIAPRTVHACPRCQAVTLSRRVVTHQILRRTCATLMQSLGSVKDAQAHLRHASPTTTAKVYMQAVPASVRAAVAALENKFHDPS